MVGTPAQPPAPDAPEYVVAQLHRWGADQLSRHRPRRAGSVVVGRVKHEPIPPEVEIERAAKRLGVPLNAGQRRGPVEWHPRHIVALGPLCRRLRFRAPI